MKISLFVIFLVSCYFGCSPVSDAPVSDVGKMSDMSTDLDVADLPIVVKNCHQYNGDRNACLEAKCDIYTEDPEVWCIKDGVCLIDKNSDLGYCQYIPRMDVGPSTIQFRSDTGIAVE